MTSAVTYAERARRSALLAATTGVPAPVPAATTTPRPNSSSSSDNWRIPTVEPTPTVEVVLEKTPAPVPKLNVWSIRKEQLAAAVVPSPAPLPTPRPSNKSTTPRTTTKSNPSPDSPQSAPNPSLPKSSSITPSTTPPPANDLPAITKRVPEGWTGVATATTLSAPDKESWPSPIEEIKKGKLKQHSPLEDAVDDTVPKKKADKTKWIPIEADITVNGTSTASRFAASSSSSAPNDKRTKRTSNNTESVTNRSRRNSTATEGKNSKSTSGNKSKNSGSSHAASNVGENSNGGERRTGGGGGTKGNASTTNNEGGRKGSNRDTAGLPSKPVGSSTAKSSGNRNGSTTKSSGGTTNLANLVAALPITVSNEVAELVSNEMAASTPVDVVSPPSASTAPPSTTTTTAAATKEKTDTPLQSISSANSTTSFSSSQTHQQYSTDLSSFSQSSPSGNYSTSNSNYRTQAPLRSNGPSSQNGGSGGSHRGGSSNPRGGGGGGRGGMRNNGNGNGNYLPRSGGGGGPGQYGGGTNGFEYDPNLAPFGFIDPSTFYPAAFPQQSPSYPSNSPYPVERFPTQLPPQQSQVGVGIAAGAGGVGMSGGAMNGVPILDPYSLDPTRYWLLGQIEYYFSFENLCRDMFLRSKMDDQGWLPIPLISSFNRIKNLSTDLSIISETMSLTPLLEMNGQFVRLRGNWFDWLLPGATKSTVVVTPVSLSTTGGVGTTATEERNGVDAISNGSTNHVIIPLKIGSPKSPARQLGTENQEGKSERDEDVEVLEGFDPSASAVNGIGEEVSATAGLVVEQKIEMTET